MAATELDVTYLNGQSERVKTTARAQILTEQQMQGYKEQSAVQAAYTLAFNSLKLRGMIEPTEEFGAWLDRVEDVAPVEDDEVGSNGQDPTRPTPSPMDSSG